MKTITLLLATLFAATAFAQDTKIGAITIDHAWARVTPGAVKNSAAFMTFNNAGVADKLISVTGSVAKEVQMHSMVTEGGMMKMREINALDIPANSKAEFKPGGYHVMLIGIPDGLKEGTKFPLKLKFEKAGEITVQVSVEKPGAQDHSEHKH
ncbi:MAG: copper chaperone PCu(A)C [Casimicrobium sp.]|jgi:copper(I)-binding protein